MGAQALRAQATSGKIASFHPSSTMLGCTRAFSKSMPTSIFKSVGIVKSQIPSQSLFRIVPRCNAFTTATQNAGKAWNIDFLTHAEVAKRFEEFDRDGNGFITVAECRAALDRLEREISDGVVRESMWSRDHNNDGVVDYFEFMDYFLNTNPEEH